MVRVRRLRDGRQRVHGRGEPRAVAGRRRGRADHRARRLRLARPDARRGRSARSRRPTCRRSRTASRPRFAPEEVRRVAPLLERFGTRLDPAYVGWAVGKPSGSGLIQGWFKLADDRPLDPIALLLVVDALPPVTFDLGLPGWAPTLELTAHVRARPGAGLGDRAARDAQHLRRPVRGGLRGLGLHRPPGRAVAPAGPATTRSWQIGRSGRSGLDGWCPFCGTCGFRLVSARSGTDTCRTGARDAPLARCVEGESRNHEGQARPRGTAAQRPVLGAGRSRPRRSQVRGCSRCRHRCCSRPA